MRWVLAVLVVVILAGLWALAFFVPDLRWFAELVTALVVVTGLVIVTVLVLRDRRERKAVAPPPEDAASEAERAIRERRADLRAALREVERVRGGRRASHALPRYLLLGAPGAGRSSLLKAWGLTKIRTAAPERGERSSGAGVRSLPLEIWGSPELLVFVPRRAPDASTPATPPAAIDDERTSFRLTLEELRRAFPTRPFEGVLVAADLARSSAKDEWAQQSSDARRQIDDVTDVVGVSVPVYALMTKADAVPGFVEFWADFSHRTETTWGASFAMDDLAIREDTARAVTREMDELSVALHARLFDRVWREGNPASRVRALGFPAAFANARAPVAAFVEELCRPGASAETARFRGLYFMSVISDAPDKGAAGAAYFAADVLRSVLLPDRGLTEPTDRERRRVAGRQVRAAMACFAVALLVIAPALASYVHNVDVAQSVEDAGANLRGAGSTTMPGTPADAIEVARDALDRCRVDAASRFAVPGWFSARAAEALQAPLHRAYLDRLEGWFTGAVRAELDRRLMAIATAVTLADNPSGIDDPTPLREAYEIVRLDATLVSPAGHASSAWSARELANVWRSMLRDGDAVPDARLLAHASEYLAMLEADPRHAWPTSKALLAARERLRKLDVRGIPYRRLLLAAQNTPPVRASAIFSPAALEFLASRGDVQIPGAFTTAGWPKIRDALRSPGFLPPSTSVERWVIEDASLPKDDASLRAQLLDTYDDEYTRRWMSFLDQLRVKTPNDVETARAELTALKEGDGFYKTIFESFKQNVVHDDPAADKTDAGGLLERLPWFKGGDDAGAKAAIATPIETSFRPVLAFAGDAPDGTKVPGAPLEKYLAILDKLKAALDAPPAPKAPGAPGLSPFDEATTGVSALLDGVEEPTRGRLFRLLMPPVNGGVQAAKAEGANTLSADWRSAVWTAWDQKLRPHYPFTRKGEPANFADFAAFFRPDGTLWGFVHAQLADAVVADGEGRYKNKPGADPVAPELLSCLTVAQEISDAFFPAGEDPGLKISVQADWTAPDVDAAKWWVGSKPTDLPKAQWAGPVRWLGEDVRVEWQQAGRPTQELGRHSFSLYDLFEHLGGLRPAVTGRTLYAVDCPPLTLKVRPEGRVDPFRPDFFSRLHCPEDVRSP